jgi:ankyrin repeat protein
MNGRYHDIHLAVEGTCDWLFEHTDFQYWDSQPRAFLWIRGKPGSGKSTLLKSTLEKFRRQRGLDQEKLLILDFFFHGRGHELQKTPLGLYRSLVHQILHKLPGALPDLVKKFGELRSTVGSPGDKWNWHQEQLRGFLKTSLPKVLEAYSVVLFVDALDECGEENAVRVIQDFKMFLEKLPSTACRFKICFSCRHYPILESDYESIYGRIISLEHQNATDIATYVQGQFSKVPPHRNTYVSLIIERASGVFLWAYLIVKRVLELERKGYNPKAIERQIQQVPKDLSDLYRELVESMQERQTSLKLIQWICFATRPLSIDELRWAVAIDPESTCMSLQEYQTTESFIQADKVDTRIKALSCGLAEVIASENKTVQFIHQSVQDFFVDKGLMILAKTSKPSIDIAGDANAHLARSCIRYLAMEEVSQAAATRWQTWKTELPLLHYAAKSWMSHAQQAEVVEVATNYLLDIFCWPSERLVQQWLDLSQSVVGYSSNYRRGSTTSIHVLSGYGLVKSLSAILSKPVEKESIDSKDTHGRTPLSLAAQKGHKAVVQLLLNTGKVDINSKDEHGWTPLLWAALYGREAVVQLLLNTGQVNIDSKDKYGQTPLLLVMQNKNEAALQLLLNTGKVDINSKNKHGQTPLSWASQQGHEAVVQQLLNIGNVDINSKHSFGRTPLFLAAENKRKAVIKLLLNTGKVLVDSKDDYGQTPLSWAAQEGHEAIVQLLLDTGKVDINSKDNFGETPLSWAAQEGHVAVVRLLLSTGKVDINSKDSLGHTPISWAAQERHVAVVRLLLDTGKVDINSKDNYSLMRYSRRARRAQGGHPLIIR